MKKLIYILILNCLSLITFCYAQPSITWQRYYTNPIAWENYGYDICKADSGNFFVIGSISSTPGYLYVIKISSYGDTIWTKIIQSFSAYTGVSTGDGGCVITGSKTSYPTESYTIKLDTQGNIVWQKFYGIPFVICYKIIKCSDNGYIVCGQADYFSAYILKIDSLGNLQWQRTYSSSYDKIFYSIAEAFDGGYIVIGYSNESPYTSGTGIIAKINSVGDSVWEKSYQINNERANLRTLEKLTNSYIVGASALDTVLERGVLSLLKVDLGGNIYFLKNFPANNIRHNYISDIKTIDDNRLAICFVSYSLNNADTIQGSVYITDTNGVVLKETTFTEASETELLRILPLDNSDIMLVGNSNFVNENLENAYVVRIDSNLYAPPIMVKNISKKIPSEFKLYQNFPNPFNPKTTIKYDLPKDGFVTFKLFDILGKQLYSKTEYKTAGTYQITLNGSNYSSGLYFYRIEAGNFVQTKKMVLIK